MPTTEITIAAVNSNFEREPLIRPFGFKGGYMTEIWQTVALLRSASGTRKIGLGTQSVLWSDAQVFAAHSESGGNALMFARGCAKERPGHYSMILATSSPSTRSAQPDGCMKIGPARIQPIPRLD